MENFHFIESNFPWFFPVVFFGFGALVGSFLNVCIYRIPKKESVVFPRSHNADGDPIAWYDNIPIFSWFLLRGKDRKTGKPFSIRYPAVEFLTAVLFLAVWMLYPPLVALVWMLFTANLVVATFVDLDHMIIPDRCSIGGMILGVILSFLVPSLHGVAEDALFPGLVSVIHSMIGLLISSAMILWIGELSSIALRKEAMGFGDVKIMACIGAFCGWEGGLFAIFGGALIGTVFLIPWLLLQKGLGLQKKSDGKEPQESGTFGLAVPFGPLLALGAMIYVLGGRTWVDLYFANVSDLLGF